MPKQRGQDRERIKVGNTFDCFVVAQHQPVHVGPFSDLACDVDLKPKLDEYQVPVSTPTVDLTAQARKAAPDALELCLCGLYADHGGYEWLYEGDIMMQEFRQSLW